MKADETRSSLDISQITEYLFVSKLPRRAQAEAIRALHIRLILSMNVQRPSKALGRPPLQLLWLPTIDSPLFPMPLTLLRRGVEAAIPVIHQGGAVLAHCRHGVHRSAAMACCVLIGMGWSAREAMQQVKERRSQSNPYTWYIQKRIVKFEQLWITEHARA